VSDSDFARSRTARTRSGCRSTACLCALANTLIVLAIARQGFAAPTEVESAVATALFNEGRALMNEGRWTEACVKLSESQRLDPGGGTLLNLALCREMEGRIATAWAQFNEALAIAERQGRADRVAFARSHIQELEPKLPHVILIVKDPAPDQELTLDGAVLRQPAWGTRVPLDPGAHVLKAQAQGRISHTVPFTLRAEQSVSVEIPRLEPQPNPPAEPHEPELVREVDRARWSQRISPAPLTRREPSTLRPWAFATLGIGAAGLSTGAIAGIGALQKQSRLDDTCRGPAHCPREQRGNIDAMNRYSEISTVAFTIGASMVAIGAVLLIVDYPGQSGASKDTVSGSALPVRMSIGVGGATLSSCF
jgi:hypothetical protein